MAVTDRLFPMVETPVVNMVQGACKNALFEPGDTRQQWKGEAAARFVNEGLPVAARYRPPTPATGPCLYLVVVILRKASASEATSSFGGDFLPEKPSAKNRIAFAL
jgi:hypothetical protein